MEAAQEGGSAFRRAARSRGRDHRRERGPSEGVADRRLRNCHGAPAEDRERPRQGGLIERAFRPIDSRPAADSVGAWLLYSPPERVTFVRPERKPPSFARAPSGDDILTC
jgi:hypothetical protein